ncbi:hypothetical protein [Xenorhabdus hominickii]|uniref:Phage protein n=1 Tax=Xenorhabdus hominickii TaxID=351679 RepID=A0A2G0Q4P7_XENHO|nr:hypothetical protein [Xenorhabdus hominickii]AOM40173.1 hypothetical protein A9255_06020 [Xenorhabdus hominickii]PHM54197.1 hypothetical protein Xhom_03272 [Xenorhabdus hominickii]
MVAFYPRMKNTSSRLLKKFGTPFTVKREGKHWVDDNGMEHHEPETRFKVIGVRAKYNPHEVDGALILANDVKLIFSAEIAIEKGDLVQVDGHWLRVLEPNPVKPADIVLCYQSQLRG